MKKIVLAGGTGFLGTVLSKYFSKKNYQVIILTRHHLPNDQNITYVKWDGQHLGPWTSHLENATAVINLNGKSVNCRYTPANKELIYDSRIDATHVLGQAISLSVNRPKVWINAASATIYPHSIEQPMTEQHTDFDTDFSVDVCKKWEAAFDEYEIPNVRKAILRIAIVLGKGSNSALTPLKKLTYFGMGGKQGNGHQMMSWLHEADFSGIVDFVINQQNISGIYNASAPIPISNKNFMASLRHALRYPFGLPAPKFILKLGGLLIGTESELVLKSRFVLPEKIQLAGYQFRFPDIRSALKDLC